MPELEMCFICDQETGRAGKLDDSLYVYDKAGDETGPLCEGCFAERDPEMTTLTLCTRPGCHTRIMAGSVSAETGICPLCRLYDEKTGKLIDPKLLQIGREVR
jgi:hypothetical protein